MVWGYGATCTAGLQEAAQSEKCILTWCLVDATPQAEGGWDLGVCCARAALHWHCGGPWTPTLVVQLLQVRQIAKHRHAVEVWAGATARVLRQP